jgi:alkaline phosphatase
MKRSQQTRRPLRALATGLIACLAAASAHAAPSVSRLTPPSRLFSFGDAGAPITSRFIAGQRFDLQATIRPDAGASISAVRFYVDNSLVSGAVTLTTTGLVSGLPAGTTVATLRSYSSNIAGVHTLRVEADQSDAQLASAEGNFEIVGIVAAKGARPRNIIFMIGDGMGIAHRTAARLMLHGARQGKANNLLAMDRMPFTGLVMTHSLNSIVTDSSPGSSCYSSGNKGNNNQHGVFPDDTTANFDNPRIEYMAEFLARTDGKSLGLVTTSDVFDATPAAWATHTQSRSAGTGICDQYFDDRGLTNLKVLMGGGRKWFLPNSTPGSARTTSTDYVLPADLSSAWGAAPGIVDPARDLLADFVADGWTYAPDSTTLAGVGPSTTKLLGLFALSNMNVALDKIDGRRGNPAVVNDYGFTDQPMLDEMTTKALAVLDQNQSGFVLMVEGASIDKQAHNMDSERWILDNIEFDRAVDVCTQFAQAHSDTLVVVSADHECGGINIIGGSLLTDAQLLSRINSSPGAVGSGSNGLRNGVVGTYDAAGFPRYTTAADGYPVTTNIDYRMLIGYAANADRREDWRTNVRPLRDSQQPFNNQPPLNTYPTNPTDQDVRGKFLVTGHLADPVAAHTASDIPISAVGIGASQFVGVMDNTDPFFKIMQAAVGGTP